MATLEETLDKAIEVAVKRALLDAHPVGSIYLTIKDENPSTKFGGTWVKLPASVCLQTADTTHGAGTTIDAGLPNITGQVTSDDKDYYWGAGTTASGAFVNAHNGGLRIGANAWSGTRGNGFTFDASRSSAIYGKSTTVQPPAYALIAWRRTA